jgi:hypothetical protein
MAAKPWQSIRSASPNTRPDPSILVEGQIALNFAAESPGVYFKAADGSLAKAGTAQVGTEAPNATPGGFAGNAAGEFWLDLTDPAEPVLKVYDGAAWVEAGGGGTDYVLQPATDTVLGGVKVGSGLDVTADGTLSLAVEVLELMGSLDPTAAAPALTAAEAGHTYVANTTGAADASFGLGAIDVAAGDLLIWTGSEWVHNQAASVSGVVSVTGTAPIEVGGTAEAPVIGVAVATTTSTGVVSVGDGLAVDGAGVLSLLADEGTYG